MLRSSRKRLPVGGSPLWPRSEPGFENFRDLAVGWKAGKPRFAEDLLPIDEHLETALAAGLQLDAIEQWRPTGHELLCQAHGPVEVVSRDAEFDRDPGLDFCHLAVSMTPYTFWQGAIPT